MNLYRLSQDKNNSYDTYDSVIVAAENESDAKMIHPFLTKWDGTEDNFPTWVASKDVKVELIGVAAEDVLKGIVLSSFNAG